MAGAFGWRPITLVVPKVEKIRGLNQPGTPRATSACRWIPLLLYNYTFETSVNPLNAELNPICHLLALLEGATIVVVSRLRVNLVRFK